MRKFADKEQTNGSKTETTLSSVDTRGSWPITIITNSTINIDEREYIIKDIKVGE